jgi:hypothetical protein
MDPRSELLELLRQYANQTIDLAALVDGMSGLAISISESDDETRSLAGLVWRLISEYDLGHRTEAGVRRGIQAALRDFVPNAARARRSA